MLTVKCVVCWMKQALNAHSTRSKRTVIKSLWGSDSNSDSDYVRVNIRVRVRAFVRVRVKIPYHQSVFPLR